MSASGAAAFDLLEAPDAYMLLTNAPGMSHDDITIDLDDQHVLSISGKKPAPEQQQQEQKQWELLHKEASTSQTASEKSIDDEDGLVEAADDEEDERVRHPGQHSPTAAASAGTSPRSNPCSTAAAVGSVARKPAVRLLFSERRDPTFKRAFKLPDNVLEEDISASLDRGVLTVRVPKKPTPPMAQPRRIAVKLVA